MFRLSAAFAVALCFGCGSNARDYSNLDDGVPSAAPQIPARAPAARTFSSTSDSTIGQTVDRQSNRGLEFLEIQNLKADAAKSFLRQKLAELDRFKSTESFKLYGFGRGGPHYQWLEKLQAERAAKRFQSKYRGALIELMGLGMHYMQDNSNDNEYTRYARREINRAIMDD